MEWNEELVRNTMTHDDAEEILSIKLCSSYEVDQLVWHYNKTGDYTVKSGYWLATHTPSNHHITPPPSDIQLKQLIWNLPTAPKIKHFLWKMITLSLPLGRNLQRCHVTSSVKCPYCDQEETAEHLFFDCSYAQNIWRASGYSNSGSLQSQGTQENKLGLLLHQDSTIPNQLKQLPWWILWCIWKCRNKTVFQQKLTHLRHSLQAAYYDTKEWLKAQQYLDADQIG